MKTWILVAGVAVGAALGAAPLGAQVQFGLQANLADEFDLGVGVRAQSSLASFVEEETPLRELTGVVSFDVYFPGACGTSDCSYLELNGNALYPLPLDLGGGLEAYAGGGLHLGRRSVEVEQPGYTSDTRVGLNVVGGTAFDLGGLAAFAEAKLGLGGWDHFVLRFGVLLGER